MRFLSVCSGIEAVSVAWEPLGFKAAGFSEIESFPCSVLTHRFPDVRNFGDITKFEEWPIEQGSVDILVGGTPCQSFSVAGLRGGLGDQRGNLALTYCRILQRYQPRWFVWENVPGVHSSWSGDTPGALGIDPGPGRKLEVVETSDFASILAGFSECGYGCAWRVLDAQYFGVPQRRRRVFVVGYLGDWRRAAEVLFEPGCVSGDSKASRKKRKDVAGSLASRTSAGGGLGTDFDLDGGLQVASTGNIAHCLNAGGMGRQDYETETMVVSCIKGAAIGREPQNGPQFGEISDISYTLNATEVHAIGGQIGVRRLTPIECERLQGFPDDWTLVPHRGKTAADGPRYKAIGNSMAVPVMRWIGKRIKDNDNRNH